MLSGGFASAEGPRYERFIACQEAIRVLHGEAQWVCYAPLGYGDKADVATGHKGNVVELRQCKASRTGSAEWTLAALKEAGVLSGILEVLRISADTRFTFTSSVPTTGMRRLLELAKAANGDGALFLRLVFGIKQALTDYRELCAAWSLLDDSPDDSTTALSLLTRLQCERTEEIGGLRTAIRRACREAFLSDTKKPASAFDALVEFIEQSKGKLLYADGIRKEMRSRGFEPLDLAGDPTAAARIERVRSAFLRRASRHFINGALVKRPEAESVLAHLREESTRVILVRGDGGGGKTGILYQIVEQLEKDSCPCLPLSFTDDLPRESTTRLGKNLGLSRSPAHELVALAGKRPAVLVIDQLDAVPWTQAIAPDSWRVTEELISEALGISSVKVVVACRNFDLRNDANLRAWNEDLESKGVVASVLVKSLAPDVVKGIVAAVAPGVALSERQLFLLGHCQLLKLWTQVARNATPPVGFSTATALFKDHWDWVEGKLREQRLNPAEGLGVVREVAELCLADRTPEVSILHFKGRQAVVHGLCSLSLLESDRTVVQFSHQTMLDYWIAERVATSSSPPLDWLKASGEHLDARVRLRYVMEQLREINPSKHIVCVREILLGDGSGWRARWHIIQLTLSHLGDVPSVRPAEVQAIVEFMGDSRERIGQAIDYALWGRPVWFEALDDAGVIEKWLQSGDDQQIAWAIRWSRLSTATCGSRVDRLLAPLIKAGGKWNTRLVDAVPHDPAEDTDNTFKFRLELIRQSKDACHLVRNWIEFRESQSRPDRIVAMIETAARRVLGQLRARIEGRPRKTQPAWDWRDHDLHRILKKLGDAEAELVWERLLPVLSKLQRLERALRRKAPSGEPTVEGIEAAVADYNRRRPITEPLAELRKSLAVILGGAMIGVARRTPARLLELVTTIKSRRVRGMRQAIADAFVQADATVADDAMRWFLGPPVPFSAGAPRYKDGERRRRAAEFLRVVGPRCSPAVLAECEKQILRYHDTIERFDVDPRNGERGTHYLGRYYGIAQYTFLKALSRGLATVGRTLSPAAEARLQDWTPKFAALRDEPSGPIGGQIVSPVHHHAAKLSDEAWRKLMTSEIRPRKHGWRQLTRTEAAESSHRQFASDFGQAARLDPTRFVKLVLSLPEPPPTEYLETLLRAIDAVEPPSGVQAPDFQLLTVQEIEALFARCDPFKHREQARPLCQVVYARDQATWSAKTIALLAKLAAEHEDPKLGNSEYTMTGADDEESAFEEDDGSRVRGGEHSIATTAINAVRPCALQALHRLLWTRADLLTELKNVVERALRDPHPAVQYQALNGLYAVGKWAFDDATMMLVEWAKAAPDRYCAWRPVHELVRHGFRSHWEVLQPLVERLATSSDAKAAQRGSIWAVAASTYCGRSSALAASCINGTLAQRIGAARVMREAVRMAAYRKAAIPAIEAFWDDPDLKVRRIAAGAFRPREELSQVKDDLISSSNAAQLAAVFVRSRSFLDDPGVLLRPLARVPGSVAHHSEAILVAARRFAEEMAESTRNPARREFRDARQLADLLLRLYQETLGQQVRSRGVAERCLDAWDALLRQGVGEARSRLRELDV